MLAYTQLELAVYRTDLGSKRPREPGLGRRLSTAHNINIAYLQLNCKAACTLAQPAVCGGATQIEVTTL